MRRATNTISYSRDLPLAQGITFGQVRGVDRDRYPWGSSESAERFALWWLRHRQLFATG